MWLSNMINLILLLLNKLLRWYLISKIEVIFILVFVKEWHHILSKVLQFVLLLFLWFIFLFQNLLFLYNLSLKISIRLSFSFL